MACADDAVFRAEDELHRNCESRQGGAHVESLRAVGEKALRYVLEPLAHALRFELAQGCSREGGAERGLIRGQEPQPGSEACEASRPQETCNESPVDVRA